MARQFIYHMPGLTKAYGGKKVLENVHLSFYPDAKIGVLGPNGSGKSTLLQDHGRPRQGVHRRGLARRGRDRRLPAAGAAARPGQDVLGNVMEGVAKKKAILDRYNELMMNYSDETADEAAKLQDEIDRQNLWDLEQQVEMAMDALGCPPERRRRDQAVRRREAPRGALQAAARAARPAAPRRADQPSRRRDDGAGWKSTCATIPARC